MFINYFQHQTYKSNPKQQFKKQMMLLALKKFILCTDLKEYLFT
ncbi:unnamed protein product [Paramecium sonneborni]|uniref:Uncharacterized protein n=1 Tax=Paramecium sonneborni TaxID=65129 RepID=A0A8S1RSJ9_9CILI|nr:unnamed protein product [Paramecium sonneborni]